jgi:hypothetical protein
VTTQGVKIITSQVGVLTSVLTGGCVIQDVAQIDMEYNFTARSCKYSAILGAMLFLNTARGLEVLNLAEGGRILLRENENGTFDELDGLLLWRVESLNKSSITTMTTAFLIYPSLALFKLYSPGVDEDLRGVRSEIEGTGGRRNLLVYTGDSAHQWSITPTPIKGQNPLGRVKVNKVQVRINAYTVPYGNTTFNVRNIDYTSSIQMLEEYDDTATISNTRERVLSATVKSGGYQLAPMIELSKSTETITGRITAIAIDFQEEGGS